MDQTQPTRRIYRACRNCARRKVKCNGDPTSCQQCSHLNLKCEYGPLDPLAKSRSHAVRGSVISRLQQERGASSSPARSLAPAGSKAVVAAEDGPSSRIEVSPGLPEKWNPDFFHSLVSRYESQVYPVNPIIPAAEVHASIARLDEGPADFAFVCAFAALTLNLTTPSWKSRLDDTATISDLVARASKAQNSILASALCMTGGGIQPYPHERFIMTAVFLEICLMAFDRYNEAFLCLREAAALAQLLRVDQLLLSQRDDDEDPCRRPSPIYPVSSPPLLPPSETARRIRMYWEVFIHERFLAIIAYLPPSLPPLPLGPTLRALRNDQSVPAYINAGFSSLIEMFTIIDADFLRNWLGPDKSGITPEWIEAKRLQLDTLEFLPSDAETPASSPANPTGTTAVGDHPQGFVVLTTLQKADLVITRQWMLTLLWQMAISNCQLRSTCSAEAQAATAGPSPTTEANDMSLQLPVRLSQQLRRVVIQLGRRSIELNGTGIVQKLFEITNTFGDVIIHVPPSGGEPEARQRRDDFTFLLDFLRDFSALNKTQEQILADKYALVLSAATG
ncbi:hypothetical protein GGTG_02572 [Gaeumannomyces tritici R3-111a-1]|uniref:Zn(2)-C6 fungal-type domain-containing protein n=1 Tax=Gaeumannomyces tritici (strain R3-111a-1) TaxID=644352 RepID=J3NMR6_GAET3|nr:hypothetical protein GGTG_02572 [Gaeumannomyces tritici R3-111a-1]EJT82599.1 hypothetical protein GGTG_02572 [Gaeumannomyces tritici R3-111a-1]